MTAVVGRRIPSLSSLVEVLLEGGVAQKAAFSFCEKVLLQKEKAERIRRGEAPASPPPPKIKEAVVVEGKTLPGRQGAS
jgi:hypothetical protein